MTVSITSQVPGLNETTKYQYIDGHLCYVFVSLTEYTYFAGRIDIFVSRILTNQQLRIYREKEQWLL